MGFYQNLAFQSQLPPKNRCGTTLENSCFAMSKEPETYKNPWIQKHKKVTNMAEMEKNIRKPEPRKVSVLPGVIRHTSCPHRPLAYYYSYK